MYGYMPMYYFDPTYVLIIIGVLLSMGASAKLNATYGRYSSVASRCGMTGAQAAQRILQSQGIYDVTVRHVSGRLTDHYDPRSKTVNLSDTVYGSTSIAAIGVAAHECGHAIQDARDYLTGIIFSKLNGKKVPSFRNLFSILMRDERSEFTDIIKCHDLTKKIPDDLSAHLYLLGFSLEAYKNTIETIREIEAVSTVLTKEKKELTQDGKKKISDVRAELNALEDELQKLEDAIESFKTNESFNAMEADLIELEDLLDQLRKRQKALRYDYEKIRKMPKPEQIDDREIKKIIDDFTDTILQIHEFIMGNKECSFSIQTIDKARRKTPVELTLRIYDDGSHSVDRTKVFIYDMALLFNQYTRDRHPLFLVHDNIFDVDQDTLVQCLNYLYKQEEQYQDFQYILTLNRDKIESEEQRKLIQMNIDEHQVAVFTKKKKFLGRDYQEK